MEYGFRKQYMSFGNFIRKGSYVDMDYIYGILSNSEGENPLNYAAFQNNQMESYVVAANALTGQAEFFDKTDMRQDCYDILKASLIIPLVCKPYQIGGIPYYDGAPDDTFGVDTLKRDKETLQKLYQKGYQDAQKISEFI